MIDTSTTKSLRERIPAILAKIEDLDLFYIHNEELLDIYEGNLLPYVEKLMKDTLDAKYFDQIKHRILPINFIQKIVDKLAKSYADSPLRTSANQEMIDFYVKEMDIDSAMMLAEEYSHLNRGYALKPKLTNKGKLKLDVLPYDKFLVIAEDKSDILCPTIFVEFLGKVERQIINENQKEEIIEVDEYIAYTDTEIVAFDSRGAYIAKYTEALGDKNPIGEIPFIYGNRSNSSVVPKPDTDFAKLARILPLMLSDINGAIMFQCFTLIYGIDVEFKDAKMNPNAIWELESKQGGDRTGSVGTLQPTVDSDKALTFFKNILAMWLDSKGIDAGSIMSLDSQSIASGLSKAMDELDTTEARKKSIVKLAKEEKHLFSLLAKMNNYWSKLPMARDIKFPTVSENEDLEIEVEFKEPMVKLDYTTEINNSVNMLQNGLSYREKEINRLHPYITDEEMDIIFKEFTGMTRKEAEEADKVEDVPEVTQTEEEPEVIQENDTDIEE